MAKLTCPECGKLLRRRNFSFNPLKNELLCRRCHIKTGTNKFYDPLWKTKQKKKKIYYLKRDEKEFIRELELRKGNDDTGAKNKIKNLINQIRNSNYKLEKEKRIKIIRDKSMQKQLIKGLGLK